MKEQKHLEGVSRTVQDLILDGQEAKALIALFREGTPLDEAESKLRNITLRLKAASSIPTTATPKEETFELKTTVRLNPNTAAARTEADIARSSIKGGVGCLLLLMLPIAFSVLVVALLPEGKQMTQEAGLQSEHPQSHLPVMVRNSSWDGSVIPVKRYLKNNLKDPSSIEFISWGTTLRNAEGNYVISVKYRAKNSFGGYVISDQVFILNGAGQVLQVNNY